MTTKLSTRRAAPHDRAGVPLDCLDLRGAVIADGLVLVREPGSFGLFTVGHGRARPIGEFTDARDAWAAVDAIDLEDLHGLQQVA